MTIDRTPQARPQIYYIRHGETEWSLSHRHTGKTDIPLTSNGEAQARAVGIRLRGVEFLRVLSSPRERARRTCELTQLATPSEIKRDLVEWNYGDYEGLTSVAISKTRPGWNIFRDGCPGGETPTEIAIRADKLIVHLEALSGNIALFSHGQFGSVLAARWIGLPLITGQHLTLFPASLSILGYNPDHPEIRVISLWNEVPTV